MLTWGLRYKTFCNIQFTPWERNKEFTPCEFSLHTNRSTFLIMEKCSTNLQHVVLCKLIWSGRDLGLADRSKKYLMFRWSREIYTKNAPKHLIYLFKAVAIKKNVPAPPGRKNCRARICMGVSHIREMGVPHWFWKH